MASVHGSRHSSQIALFHCTTHRHCCAADERAVSSRLACSLHANAAPASKHLMPGAFPGFGASRDFAMDCDASLGPWDMSVLPSPQIAVCSFAGSSMRIQHTAVCLMMIPCRVLRECRIMWAGFKFPAESTLSKVDARRHRAAAGLRWEPGTQNMPQLPHSHCCRVWASAGAQWQAADQE